VPSNFTLITGSNVSHAFAWTQKNHVQLGLVAYSHLRQEDIPSDQYRVIQLPGTIHLNQSAIVLAHTPTSTSQKRTISQFYDYLKSSAAKHLIKEAGYHVKP